jgi:hypothetical protein
MTLNLEQRRGEPSVWDRVGRSEWDIERWLTAVASGACLVTGVRRRSLGGLMLALGGSGLAWWAAGGLDERQLRRSRVKTAVRRASARGDVVTEAAKESFPASDPPPWTPTTGSARAEEDGGARPGRG